MKTRANKTEMCSLSNLSPRGSCAVSSDSLPSSLVLGSSLESGTADIEGHEWALIASFLGRLIDDRRSAEEIRCWVPACGTGESAYTMAILLAEVFRDRGYHQGCRIFATDCNEEGPAAARAGVYAEATFDHLPGAARHFRCDRGCVRISQSIREMVVFSRQNPLLEPPFSRLDVVRGDRLFLDLDEPACQRLVVMFHYVLNPGGVLWLGPMVPVPCLSDWFEPIDWQSTLFRRRDRDRAPASSFYGFDLRSLGHAASRATVLNPHDQLESDNEELQTLNEALQAANEEVLVTNQELEATNQELRARSDQLRATLSQVEVSEARYRSVVEDQSEFICRHLSDGTITFVNTAFCTAQDKTRAQLLGRNFADMLPIGEALRARLSAVTGDQPLQTFEYHIQSADGTSSWQHWSHRALFDEAGSVIEYQSVGQDITRRVEAEAQNRFLASHDQLTGLENRYGFFERLHGALALAKRMSERIAIHYLDLDHFKDVNDSLGHTVGDGLLQSVARRLEGTLRPHDYVARLGGDEFAVVQTLVRDFGDAAELATRLLDTVQGDHEVEGHQLRASTTIGIAVFPEDGADAKALLQKADLSMYRAKELGSNRFSFYTQGLNERVARRQRLQAELTSAVETGQFRVHFQPIVNLHHGRIEAAEALLRWQHPTKGPIVAAEFIDVLESSRENVGVGEWVLENACRDAKCWLKSAAPGFRLNVNLSVNQLKQPELVDRITMILDQVVFDPARLELEITEHAVIDVGLVEVESKLRQLNDLGIHIALDDFGTGYSSLTLLRNLPISHIKIDRSFVVGLKSSAEDTAIVNAVLDLGKSLSLGVTAEGVESQDVLDRLKMRGCDEAQGYHIGDAVVAHEFAGLLGKIV